MATSGGTVVALRNVTAAGGLAAWQSTDAGQTWTLRTIAAYPGYSTEPSLGSDGTGRFLAAMSTTGGARVFESKDSGETWTELPVLAPFAGRMIYTSRIWLMFLARRIATTPDPHQGWNEASPVPRQTQRLAGVWTGGRAILVGDGLQTGNYGASVSAGY
jgi:hypothetical protein